MISSCHPPERVRGGYCFSNPFRALVTVNDPSARADTLIQYAGPLCTGGGGAPEPGCGAGIGAIGIAVSGSSNVLAMNKPGTVNSCPLSTEKCSCQRSSSPGAE